MKKGIPAFLNVATNNLLRVPTFFNVEARNLNWKKALFYGEAAVVDKVDIFTCNVSSMPNTVASFSIVCREGLPMPVSTILMVRLVTPLISARSSWVSRNASRLSLNPFPISSVSIGSAFQTMANLTIIRSILPIPAKTASFGHDSAINQNYISDLA
jgi:hypothetical protein